MARQARKTAQQVAQKWSQNLQSATVSITNGVNAVQTAPTQLAAAQDQAYLAGVQRNVGKWKAKLGAVTLQDWKQSMIQKGIPHLQTAAVADQPKVQQAFGQLLPFVYDTRDAINSQYPRGSLQQNVARMTAFVNAMAQYNSGG